MKRWCLPAVGLSALLSLFGFVEPVRAQSAHAGRVPGSLGRDLQDFVAIPTVSGYEKELGAEIAKRLSSYSPTADALGDVIVSIGSGLPNRLLVAPMDEPGYVVSDITPDGYLRVQRLPQFGILPLFEDLYAAQPIRVGTSDGGWRDGVVAGLSVHLQPGRANAPKADDIESMFVDIGAASPKDVRSARVDLLSPLAIGRQLRSLGEFWNAAGVGDRFGDAALVELLRRLDPTKVKGTLTIAFVVQQWTGARGLQRVLDRVHADEMIYIGRLTPGGPIPGMQDVRRSPRQDPGSGVLFGLPGTGENLTGFSAELKALADANKLTSAADYSGPLLPHGYLPMPDLPANSAHLGVATAWPSTPAELLNKQDLQDLIYLLEAYTQGATGPSAKSERGYKKWLDSDVEYVIALGNAALDTPLSELTESYGVSGHEESVREKVKSILPKWAKPETDDAGNLILHLGSAPAGSKTPKILIVAHMDEIGFAVKSISKDGRLEVEWRGGGELSFYAGHPALVHSGEGRTHDAIVELPNGWDRPSFKWPRQPETAIRVDVGARSADDAAALGIRAGDWVTIRKEYHRLVGTRANGRSFDDRVGCAALISAVTALGPELKGRDVTFVWSTGEEEGLVGAAALAKRLAAEGNVPDYVFAVDTFVSSDSPLESKRFADAELGKGFVIRAVDNSNIVPADLVQRVIHLAKQNNIPVQYGVTGGGNDGSAFTRYGAIDIALGWPLRYSHSPAEVIDTRDLDALSRIIAAIARSW